MLQTEAIIGIAAGILIIGGIITWLIWRRLHSYSFESEPSTQYSGIHISHEQYPSKSYDLDMLIKPDEELRKLFFANADHESTYKSILKDSDLIKKIRSSKNEDEARKVLIAWLKRHQSEKNSKSKGENDSSSKEIDADKSKTHSLPKSKEESTKETDPKKTNSSQSPKSISKPEVKPDVRPDIAPPNPKAVEAYKEIVKLLDEHDIDRIVSFIKELPNPTLRMILQDYARIRVVSNSKKADILFSKAKGKQDLILSVEEEIINSLKSRYESLRERIVTLRKSGVNVNHEDLLLGMIPPKIKAFSLTLEKSDLSKVQDLLLGLDKEIALKEPSGKIK